MSELTTGFTMEILLKPEELPQFSVPFYNGVYGTNGWGIQIANAAGTGVGSLLIFRHSSGVVVNTTLELKPGQWNWIGITWSGTTLEVGLVRVDPTTKAVTPAGVTATPTIVKPTTGSFIGSASGATAMPFKGWIDEVLVYNGNLSLAEPMGIGSWEDRWQTAIYSSPPPGFILPDGTAVSRAKYDRLFKTIGTIYGAGDGTNTFNLPDLIGRVPVGKDDAGLRVAAFIHLGQASGSNVHVLTVGELPSHSHTFYGGWGVGGGNFLPQMAENMYPYGIAGGSGNGNVVHPEGNNYGHDNMQPYLMTNYLLKT
jgi:microcystin-dependent protein